MTIWAILHHDNPPIRHFFQSRNETQTLNEETVSPSITFYKAHTEQFSAQWVNSKHSKLGYDNH